jgi:Rrf2 family protein
MPGPANTQFSVAVHLLTLLAGQPGTLVDSATLAVSPATNPVHVRRILGRLRTVGLVRSQPGTRGGWALARPAGEIDLAQVWDAVNGDDPVLGVHIPDPDCPVGRQVQQRLLDLDRRAAQVMIAELARSTIADVLEGTVSGAARISRPLAR